MVVIKKKLNIFSLVKQKLLKHKSDYYNQLLTKYLNEL